MHQGISFSERTLTFKVKKYTKDGVPSLCVRTCANRNRSVSSLERVMQWMDAGVGVLYRICVEGVSWFQVVATKPFRL